MSRLIVPLEDAGAAGAALAGGKAAALGSLLAAGFPVPAGFCLTTTAFHLALAPHREAISHTLAHHDLADPAGAAAAATALDVVLAGLSLPAPVSVALAAALPGLAAAATLLVVRSSATAEDRVDASFAGYYTSVLGVRELDEVSEAILTCWRAFFSAPALAGRAAHHALDEREGMALLLQPLLEAGCAGAAFSLDPVAPAEEVAVVNAAWGLGGGVAEGTVPADTYRIAQRGGGPLAVTERRLVPQPTRLALDESNRPTLVPVPEAQQKLPTLPEAWAVRIAELALATAAARGRPQEIEWAITGNRLWLLQSRPLTGLPPDLAEPPPFPVTWEKEEDGHTLWHRANLTGRESGLLRPLEYDYVRWRNFTTREARRWAGRTHIRRARIFNGYTYMDARESDLSPGDRRARRAAMEDLVVRLRGEGRTLWDHWGPEVIGTAERIMALDLETEDGEELARHLETTLGGFRFNWTIHPLLWEGAGGSLAEAYTAVTGQSGEEARPVLADLVQGEETALTRLLDALYALAQTARKTPAVAALVRQGDAQALARLQTLPAATSFWQQLKAFLILYGNRCGYGYGSETMFQVPTWHERPELVLRLLIPYLDPAVGQPAAARARRQEERDAQVEAICAACDDPQAVATFRRELAYARRQAIRLEEHNHYIDQLTEGQMRRAIRAAGRCLVALGAITALDDIYWLRFQEILDALRADSPPALATTVEKRREENAAREQLLPPLLLGIPDPALPERPPPEAMTRETPTETIPGRLEGQAASAGRYSGRARIIANTVLVPDLAPGEVLVAENVGPLWTPLFPTLGALVLDGGNLGQHAAATAREYGIPAVIRTVRGTERIPEGAQVLVDGTAGVVTWELSA